MKTGTRTPTASAGLADRLRELTPSSSDCVILETAQDHRNLGGNMYALNKEGMKFKTGNGDKGTVNVWRVK